MDIVRELRRFHRDESGAPELSTVMIVALIAIPLLIAIILFANKAYDSWQKSTGSGGIQKEKGDLGKGKPGWTG